MTETQQKEELKIKDLLVKLQVLSKGILDERKKSQSYLERIKEYDDTIQKKDSEIVELQKEKFDLKSKLTIEKNKKTSSSRKGSSGLFNSKSGPSEDTITKYEEAINELKFTNKDLTSRLMDERENYDQQKIKFQTLITLQNQKVIEKDKELLELKNTNTELEQKVESLNRLVQQYEDENASYTTKFKDLKEENEGYKNRLDDSKSIINNFKKMIEEKENDIKKLKKNLGEYANMLANMKNQTVNKLLQPKSFKVERLKKGIGHKAQIVNLTFQKNPSNNQYEVVFKKEGDPKEEHVNLLDFTSFDLTEKDKNKINITYIYEGAEVKATLTVHELLFDYFFQTYRDFNKKANENL